MLLVWDFMFISPQPSLYDRQAYGFLRRRPSSTISKMKTSEASWPIWKIVVTHHWVWGLTAIGFGEIVSNFGFHGCCDS